MRWIVAAFALAAAPVDAAPREWVASHKSELLSEYLELLAIPNVASDSAGIRRNAEHISAMMARRGLSPRLLESDDGKAPPLIYGEWNVAGARRTLVLYAHYDGQPVTPEDWTVTEPFVPKLVGAAGDDNARLYARSASDDKAGVMAILAAVDALRAERKRPSFNMKIVFEGEEEAGSPNLAALLRRHKSLLASDGWIIIDGPAHAAGPPQLVLGVRGISAAQITVYGPSRPLHSGHYGNWAPNPAMMLAELLATMKDDNGRVLVAGFYDDVEPLSEGERAAVAAVPDADAQLRRDLGLGSVEGGGAKLTELILQPSLNVNGLKSADVGGKARNVIPASATASLDLRLVKGNDPRRQFDRLAAHVRGQGYEVLDHEPTMEERRRFPRIARIEYGGGYPAERTPLDHPLALDVKRALAGRGDVVVLPSLGGSLPLYLIRQELAAPNVGLALWNHDNNQHAEDENIRLGHLWAGIEIAAAVMTMR
jgi:acetylornithine deacetylase/succinyl-diaminopimelate desuccinylase-like protein